MKGRNFYERYNHSSCLKTALDSPEGGPIQQIRDEPFDISYDEWAYLVENDVSFKRLVMKTIRGVSSMFGDIFHDQK